MTNYQQKCKNMENSPDSSHITPVLTTAETDPTCGSQLTGTRALYFDCLSGISGDMTLAALIHLGADLDKIRKELMTLDIGPFDIIPHEASASGISGIDLEVKIPPEEEAHVHRTFAFIRDMITRSGLSHGAKSAAIDIFSVIGRAEAAVHGKPLDEVTFHEVGAVDSIIDIVGTAVAIDLLGSPKIFCGPVHDGGGFVNCRHGQIPVPVPAVVEMLPGSGIPIIIESDVATEMVTPTGFGILAGLSAEFRRDMGLIIEKSGYGFGKRKTKEFNALRIILGEEYNDKVMTDR